MSIIANYPQPQIHLNGTGRTTLAAETDKAQEALLIALELFRVMTTHPRDFYVLDDPEAYEAAAAKRMEMGNHFHAIAKYLDVRAQHLGDL